MLPQAADFRAEADALHALLITLKDPDWDRATLFKQWTVNDAQGFQTVVTLFNLDLTTRPDPSLFSINESLTTSNSGAKR